jgi:hypothetical protein
MAWQSKMPIRSPTGMAKAGSAGSLTRPGSTPCKGIVPPTAPPVPEAPGPFSFGDQGRVARILTAAGFTDIAIAPFDASIPFGEGARLSGRGH